MSPRCTVKNPAPARHLIRANAPTAACYPLAASKNKTILDLCTCKVEASGSVLQFWFEWVFSHWKQRFVFFSISISRSETEVGGKAEESRRRCGFPRDHFESLLGCSQVDSTCAVFPFVLALIYHWDSLTRAIMCACVRAGSKRRNELSLTLAPQRVIQRR